jgi:hypothetical protein
MMEFCGEQGNKAKKILGNKGEHGEIFVGNKARISTGTQPPSLPPPRSSSKELNLLLNFKLSMFFEMITTVSQLCIM